MANILLIDLSSISHAMWHVCANEPDPNAASIKTVERVRALASGQPHVAICLDAPPYFRMDIAPDYKAKRDKDNNAVISQQFAVAADTLRADGFPVWAVKGYEADDVIGSAVHKVLQAQKGCPKCLVGVPGLMADPAFNCDVCDGTGVPKEGRGVEAHTVTIASADKDLCQLVSDRVSLKSLKDGSLLGPDEVKAKFGVWPHQMRDYLALVGDASDNIVGCRGIGAKRAAELLELYGNLDDLFVALTTHGTAFTPAMATNLREFQPRLATVRSLIALRTDVPVPFDEVFRERVPADVAVFGDESVNDDVGRAADIEEAMPTIPLNPPILQAMPPATEAMMAAGERLVDGLREKAAELDALTPKPPQMAPGATNGAPPAAQPAPAPARLLEPEVLPPPATEFTMQLEPRSIGQAKQIAADLFASRMFSAYGNAPAVLSTIMAGRELGFQAMASLRAFHIIEGKPALSAGAIHSLVLTSGKAKYFRCTERTAEKATFTTQRGDEPPMTLTFTIAEARQAWAKDQKAWDASGWGRNPADMLVARALTKLARLVYPDITHGLFAPEELS